MEKQELSAEEKAFFLITEKLRREIQEIKAELSKIRKAGGDAFIINLKIMNIPAKIQMAEVTKSQEDIKNIRAMIDAAKIELAEEVNRNSSLKSNNK